MRRFLADENFDRRIVLGLIRQRADLDIVSVNDVGLRTRGDPTILAWAAAADRVLLTHDVRTIVHFAGERIGAGEPMAGVVIVQQQTPIATAIDDILLLVDGLAVHEWENHIWFVPL